jgi:hypothetical protein
MHDLMYLLPFSVEVSYCDEGGSVPLKDVDISLTDYTDDHNM